MCVALTKHFEHAGGLAQFVLTDAVVQAVVVRVDPRDVELHAGLETIGSPHFLMSAIVSTNKRGSSDERL